MLKVPLSSKGWKRKTNSPLSFAATPIFVPLIIIEANPTGSIFLVVVSMVWIFPLIKIVSIGFIFSVLFLEVPNVLQLEKQCYKI